MWPARRSSGANALSRYWTALVHRAPDVEIARLAGFLEPDLVATIERMRSARNEPPPNPAFVDRLEDELMRAFAPSPNAMPVLVGASKELNGRNVASAGHSERPARCGTSRRLAWPAASLSAAAAILLVLALSLASIGLNWRGDDRPKSIPAAAVPATVTPTVEFLWSSSGNPADPMENATNLAIAPDGNIWVPDGRNGRFQIFSPEGELLEVWGSEGTGDGQFDFLMGGNAFGGYGRGAIAFAPDGSFYVADTANHRIQKFGSDRAFITSWGGKGTADGQFEGASDLAVDSEGRVYVVDANRGGLSIGADVVQVFDADGVFLDSWGTMGGMTGELHFPVGITVDRDGSILIASYNVQRIQRFMPDGAFVDSVGEPGVTEGGIDGPFDVAVDAEGHIFEVDYNQNRVQVFDRDGRFLIAWGAGGTTEDGIFQGPVAVAVDDVGNVYVADDSGRVQKFRVTL